MKQNNVPMKIEPYRIPLRDRVGEIVDYTIVDSTDYTWLSQWQWRRTGNGYVGRGQRIDGKYRMIFMHREILGLEHGSGERADHINGKRLDNRRENLRVATVRQNNKNRRSRPGSKSSYVGVSWHARDGKWRSRVRFDGKECILGYYNSEFAAARAYDIGKAILAPDPNYHYYNHAEGPVEVDDARRIRNLERRMGILD
jgi:hypothetical protein